MYYFVFKQKTAYDVRISDWSSDVCSSYLDQSAPRRRKRNPWAYGVLVAVLLGLGVVVWQGLTSASLYFYNADEAVEQRDELGGRRFRQSEELSVWIVCVSTCSSRWSPCIVTK